MSCPGALRAWDTAQQGKTMAIRVHVDVVSAEEFIFSCEMEFAVFPGEAG